jgi:hypothetical protein
MFQHAHDVRGGDIGQRFDGQKKVSGTIVFIVPA